MVQIRTHLGTAAHWAEYFHRDELIGFPPRRPPMRKEGVALITGNIPGRILIFASLERASGLLGQLESWNGSKTQGTPYQGGP
jgi:hypothetical protein